MALGELKISADQEELKLLRSGFCASCRDLHTEKTGQENTVRWESCCVITQGVESYVHERP
jgi:hypothetical protein